MATGKRRVPDGSVVIKRSDAAKLIEEFRVALAHCAEGDWSAAEALARIQNEFVLRGIESLKACDGEAHRNPYIDSCGRCMPRWGVVGPTVRIS